MAGTIRAIRKRRLYGNLKDLSPIRAEVGEDEILLNDARRYAERVASADSEVQVHTLDGMPDVFPANVGVLHAADAALNQIASFLRGTDLRH